MSKNANHGVPEHPKHANIPSKKPYSKIFSSLITILCYFVICILTKINLHICKYIQHIFAVDEEYDLATAPTLPGTRYSNKGKKSMKMFQIYRISKKTPVSRNFKIL